MIQYESEWDYEDGEAARCDACDEPLEPNQFGVCDECTGLAHCPDDMCHGAGYCMHDPAAWRP